LLPHDVLAELKRLRGEGESLSDVILALAKTTEN
jgi:predicted CopG family antitoxin